MSDILNLQSMIAPTISGIIGVVGSTFWVMRWINKTDRKLDEIQKDVSKIMLSQAVTTKTQEGLSQACKCFDKRLTDAEKKIWSYQNG